jgi:hypothetical protein
MAYVPNSIRRASLLTDQDNRAINELLVLRTGLGNTAETRINASKKTSETDDENQTKTQFMSSQAFRQTPCGRVQEAAI